MFPTIESSAMTTLKITRRIALLGGVSALSGCSAVAALNSAGVPLDTFDLLPAGGATSGRRTSHSLLVALPQAPAAIASDRIVVKPDPASITYLPAARWSDEAPVLLQSLLIRSIAATGRIGYVGRSDGGPVPDTALLVRMDAFDVNVMPDGTMLAKVNIALTVLDDSNQRLIASRSFSQSAPANDDTPAAIVAAFQTALNSLLPTATDWVMRNA